jgi:hypothetical protein
MIGKSVKDVTGVIKKITQPVSKTFTAKKGKNIGKDFTVFSIGVMLDDGEYYNIKGKTETDVLKYLYCDKFQRNYSIGDEVKIYLEAEDAENKYWRIASITPLNPMDNIAVEDLSGDESEEVEEEPSKQAAIPEEDEATVLDKATKAADEQYHIKPVEVTPKQATIQATATTVSAPKTVEEAQTKDIKRVNDYKTTDADKYELGMAKNAAAVLMSGLLHGKTLEDAKILLKTSGEFYDKLIISLYNRGKKVREQVLGY